MAKPPGKFRYVDDVSVRETFVDGFHFMTFDGTTARLDLTVHRYEEPKPPAPPTGTEHIVCRLVMTPDLALRLHHNLTNLIQHLERLGKVTHEDTVSGRVN